MNRIFMRYPNGLNRAITFSMDDGVQQDMWFINLLEQYGMKGTFNLNSGRFISRDHVYPEGKVWRAMVDEDVLPTYTNPHADVACHTVTHPTLMNASEAEIADEILTDRINLERRFGRIITGLAIPNGPYDDTTIDVGKRCGLTYMRSVRSSYSFEFPKELCPFDPTCAYDDEQLPDIIDRFFTERCKGDPFLLYIWGHTYCFEGNNQWDEVEQLVRSLAHHDNVWYASDAEIFDYALKWKMLEKSADGHILYNPTDITLWYANVDGYGFSIASGEEKVI